VGFEPEERRISRPTPFESELRAGPPAAPRRAPRTGRVASWRRRRRQRAPQTRTAVVALGLTRLAVAFAVGAAVAVLVARWLDRSQATGFYFVGAAVLALAFFFSAADMNTEFYENQPAREHRIRTSLVYVLVGALLVGTGVLLEAL
jgi:protein-S-isoprenylcysteine O-methyltransferase Ste14